jgi:hypothetical protein
MSAGFMGRAASSLPFFTKISHQSVGAQLDIVFFKTGWQLGTHLCLWQLKGSCREQEMKSRNHLAIRMMRILLASLSAKHQMVNPSTRESVFNFFPFHGFATLDAADTLVRTSYAWPLY